MVLYENKNIVFANEETARQLDAAIEHAHKMGGELQSSMKTCLEHIERLGANVGRVRVSSEDFNFFNLWVQQEKPKGEWSTVFNGALVGFGLKYEHDQIRVRSSSNPSWSIHS